MKDLDFKNDEFLVEMSLLGHKDAYGELVTRYEQAVKSTAFKVTENEFSAEDASQDAFVSAWIKLDSLRDRGKFGSWVCSIAKNRARDIVIHYSNAAADISLDLLQGTRLAAAPESGLSDIISAAGISEQERDARLHEAVDALSEKIRETVKFHYFSGLSVAEIARVQNLPIGTVKWRLNEGRRQLRKEYGIMNKNEDNMTFTERVLYQVEQLKLWQLKNDKTGFEQEYRRVLCDVEKLEESDKKQHALADVLLRGYWWIPGEKNSEVLAKLKRSAELSHNEDVMQAVMRNEWPENRDERLVRYILDVQIPYLTEHGFTKTIGYEWFWIGYYYFTQKQLDESLDAFQKVLVLLSETDVYYANALAAIEAITKLRKAKEERNAQTFISASGETLKYIDGKLYFWNQPGFSTAGQTSAEIMWNCSRCDCLLLDESLKAGDSIVSCDGKATLTCTATDALVKTPTGEYENCTCMCLDCDCYGLTYCETYFCPDIGIVKQSFTCDGKMQEWYLSDYKINGGDGLLPFAKGNYWNYNCIKGGIIYDIENSFEVVSFKNDTVVLKMFNVTEWPSYDSWLGNIVHARQEYCNGETLIDVRGDYERAESLAVTQRQKVHTAVARRVFERILNTDPVFSPDGTQKGHWDFFELYDVIHKDKNIHLFADRAYSFEWKDMHEWGDEGHKLLYNNPLDDFYNKMGIMWSPEWLAGYRTQKELTAYNSINVHIDFEVLEDTSVSIALGEFSDCRHIHMQISGYKGGLAYFNGSKHYWFAPDIGIVKYSSDYKNGTLETVWELTEYQGTADGYFPVADGLFRRYEPTSISNGWHASVEYTYVEDENGAVIFRDALGNRDREPQKDE